MVFSSIQITFNPDAIVTLGAGVAKRRNIY